jgi:hypothetical protein
MHFPKDESTDSQDHDVYPLACERGAESLSSPLNGLELKLSDICHIATAEPALGVKSRVEM